MYSYAQVFIHSQAKLFVLVYLYIIVCLTTLLYIGDKEYMYYVNVHVAEIVGINFASMMPQFIFNRPPLRFDTGGGDADRSRYADYVNLPPISRPVRLNWTCARHQPLQDVVSFASSLPEPPSELNAIVVRKKGAKQSHRDFCVGRSAVHRTQ